MTARRTPVRTLATTLALALALLAGCGDGDDAATQGAEPTPSTSASSSATPSPSPTGPAPATGPVLRVDGVEVTVPEGWRRLDKLVSMVDTAGPRDGTSTITVSSRPDFGNTLDELADVALDSAALAGVSEREPDVEVAGVTAYHVVSTREDRDSPWWIDQYGGVSGDQAFTLVMNLEKSLSGAERAEIREQVLASVAWR